MNTLFSLSISSTSFFRRQATSFMENSVVLTSLHQQPVPTHNPSEVKLLELIESGRFSSIKIDLRNKKMIAFELTEPHNPKRKITELLREGNFQTVITKVHKGVVTRVENIVKVFLD